MPPGGHTLFPGIPIRRAPSRSRARRTQSQARVSPLTQPKALVILFFAGAFGEDFFGGLDAIERGGESGVNRHLNHDLDDFLLRAAHIERAANGAQLRSGGAQSRERSDRGNFARFHIQAGTRDYIAKDVFGEVLALSRVRFSPAIPRFARHGISNISLILARPRR